MASLFGKYYFLEEFLLEKQLPCLFNDPVPIFSAISAGQNDPRPKVKDFVDNVVDVWSESEFRRHFRISKTMYSHLLNEFRDPLKKINHGGYIPIPPKDQLYIFIWYLANLDSQREIALLFGVSEWFVHTCIKNVAEILSARVKQYISWPSYERQRHISEGFETNTTFPGIVGVMDGTHIRIVNCPGGQQDYINRKGFASIQAQLIVDDKLMINDVNVGWPGSTHDARVLRNSGIFHNAENNGKILQNHYIIADGAYPLKWWLMTPFRDNGRLNNAQRRYNRIFSSARQCVERAIGHLKGRFRRLQNLHVGSVTHMCNLVTSACILHNMCIICDDYIDDFMDMTQAEDINQYPNVFQNAADGANIRDRLVAIL
jgi:hypothetical protein